MSEPIRYDSGASLLSSVTADVNSLMSGQKPDSTTQANGSSSTTGSSSGSSAAKAGTPNAQFADVLGKLGDLLKSVAAMLGGQGEGSSANAAGGSASNASSGSSSGAANSASSPAASNASSSSSSKEADPIAGKGRIHGDPHFEGQDGDKYDVQGEAGKTYNLLSDKNFQMNGRFDAYGAKGDGATAVGAVGISAGKDQIEVSKDGKASVNGRELKQGDRVELADGGSVEYGEGKVSISSGEWKTDVSFQESGDTAHLNIDVETKNAIADGVKPHGLLGQTFDADKDARKGDAGSGAQGGGAIAGSNGNVSKAGDKDAVKSYEVDNLHDRNFDSFNKFFDKVESNPSGSQDELSKLMASAFEVIGQSMLMMQQMMQQNTLRSVA